MTELRFTIEDVCRAMMAIRGLSQRYSPEILDQAVNNVASAVRSGEAAFTSDEIQELERIARIADEDARWRAIGGFVDHRLLREIEALAAAGDHQVNRPSRGG